MISAPELNNSKANSAVVSLSGIPVVKYNIPADTTPVSQEVVQTAASNVNINPETGLTRIDDALLSQEEKAMRLRQKGMTA